MQLGSENQWSKRTLAQECDDKVEMVNISQQVNSKNNAWDLASIKLCEVLFCEAITFHSISDFHSTWPALLIQDMSMMSGAIKSVSMPWECEFC